MSETTPDPAVVHTGTDRVELTDAERATLRGVLHEFKSRVCDDDCSNDTYAAVESIVAARVQALTAEREELRTSLDYWVELWKKAANGVIGLQADLSEARAELASANTRCAELEDALPKRTNDWLAHCKRLDAERDAVSDDLCKAWKELGEVEAENAALRATLDRVTALADEWDGSDGIEIALGGADYVVSDLRAALTPEGKP